MLVAILDPLDRPADELAGKDEAEVLAEGVAFQPEGTADVAGDDAQPIERKVERRSQLQTYPMGTLVRGVVGELTESVIEVGHGAASLHRNVGDPVLAQRDLDDPVGVGERGVDVAAGGGRGGEQVALEVCETAAESRDPARPRSP